MKKAQVTIYVSYLLVAFIILAITAVVAPAGALFTAEAYTAGQGILERANESIQSINNDTVRARITALTDSAYNAAETNIEVTTDLFKYSWVIMLALIGIVLFLYSRQIVEYSRGGGFV